MISDSLVATGAPPSPRPVPDHCRFCPSRQNGVCAALDAPPLAEVALGDRFRSNWRRVKAGDAIFRQGDPADLVCTVIDGWVCLVQESPGGERQIVDFVLKDGLFGIEPYGLPYGHTAEALTEATICIVPRAAHDRLRHANLAFNDAIESALACVVRRAFDELSNLGQGGGQARVAHLLFGLAVRSLGRRPSGGLDRIRLPLRQSHIASAVGLTVVHVSRVLARLRDEGLLEFRGQTLRILDPGGVEELADVADDTIEAWMAEKLGCWPQDVRARA